MGDGEKTPLKLNFDARVCLEFRGASNTSDAGLLVCRELDDALGLTETATACLQESRGGRNVQHQLVALLRLCFPKAVKHWSLRSVQIKLIKIGARLVRHARRLVFQFAEAAVPREVFRQVLERIARLHPAPG